MNQILSTPHRNIAEVPNFNVEFSDEVFEIPYDEDMKINKMKKFFSKFNKDFFRNNKLLSKNYYRIQFFISIIIAALFLIFLLAHIHNSNAQEKISKELLNNYTLTTLYQEKNLNVEEQESYLVENPFVIGMIRISKINLNYPILSESSEELLKISLCRFAGPMPNERGNLCIAGHNYLDARFFGRLKELNNDDLIEIYDLSGRKINYSVFDKYEIYADDLSCTNQDVGEAKIVTLITCNNVSGKRTVIKAKEVSE